MDAIIQSILESEMLPPLPTSLSDSTLALVERLKAEADRHWRIDPHLSLRFAAAIVQIGENTKQAAISALGLMARGDALKYLDQMDEAWQTLSQAGDLYHLAGDEVGWARTCIGKVGISVALNRVDEALQEAESAREILHAHGEDEKLLRLELNVGAVLNYLGDYRSALEQYQATLTLAERLGDAGAARLNIVHFNMGYAYQGMGNLREAADAYERARNLMVTRGESVGVALAELNIASIAQAQGEYKRALNLLHTMRDMLAQYQPSELPHAQRDMIECYLFLNRFSDARDLARSLIEQHDANHESYDLALTLLQLAVAETALGAFEPAYAALERAETLLGEVNAEGWLGVVHLRWAQAALRQRDLETARQQARLAIEHFSANEQQIYHAAAQLVAGQIALQAQDVEAARQSAVAVEQVAHQWQIPELEYGAHLLQARAAESTGRRSKALHHFQTAAGIVEEVQRGLILLFRSDFLEDKQDAVQGLLRLHLQSGEVEDAFAALERAKAQVWLGYLSQRDQLRWFRDDPATRPFVDELERLRQEHHWFYRVAYDQVFREHQHAGIAPEQAALEAKTRERDIRALTERLYLNSEADERTGIKPLSVTDIQQALDADAAMLAYYSDGSQTWAFLIAAGGIKLYPLGTCAATVDRLIAKLQANFDRALRVDMHSADAQVLNDYAQRIARQLYDLLVAPLASELARVARVVVVPYGSLHYLPFHLLRDADGYWLERHEITILPTASLVAQKQPTRKRGALALAHSWDGRLPHTSEEAQRVSQRFEGDLFREAEAVRARLDAAPCQILHLSVHGEYRMDQPDFSYLQLADGPLYTDDLFQRDLSYELVTLSACETGRSAIAAGDELVGLGRGFLFAGAGALLASLWRVEDSVTLEFMACFYDRLDAGASKAAAVRDAQTALLRNHPELHPAYWGAFELIGSPLPLSSRSFNDSLIEKRIDHVTTA